MSAILSGGPFVVTQKFGCTDFSVEIPDPDCPEGYFHSGIDLGAPCGVPVLSGGPGLVTQIGAASGTTSLACGGRCKHGCLGPNAVGIRTPQGLTAWYGHLMSHLVQKGQSVSRGQEIGRVGTLGCSTGCHLHFELDPPGLPPLTLAAIDPTPYLQGWFG